MNIVGFNFTKISAERKRAVVGTVNIKNNVTLNEIKKAQIGIGEGERQAVRVSFTFSSEFTPDLAVLSMSGDILSLLEKKQADAMIKDWEKNKKLPQGVAQRIMNHILDRCNIQALLLAKDLNLPSPVPLPKVNVAAKKTPAKPVKKAAKKK